MGAEYDAGRTTSECNRSLADRDFSRLRRWFAEQDWQRWDRQLETDVTAGKLDFLIEEALSAKQQGNLKDL